MCGAANVVSRGLGDIFTGGLAETNLGGGIFKKAGNAVGNALTLQPPSGMGGSNAPAMAAPVVGAAPIDSGADLTKLQQIFGPVQTAADATIDQNYADSMRKLRANQAARGVLQSGVADYPSTELAKNANTAKAQVAGGLANILGNTEASRSLFDSQAAFEKYMADKGFANSIDMANTIAALNKPSQLQQIFGAVGQLTPAAVSLASLF